MTKTLNISGRQFAAYMERKYFSGEIFQNQVIDSFPSYDNNSKIELLYKRIMNKLRKNWLFGVSKNKYEKYIIINELEND